MLKGRVHYRLYVRQPPSLFVSHGGGELMAHGDKAKDILNILTVRKALISGTQMLKFSFLQINHDINNSIPNVEHERRDTTQDIKNESSLINIPRII